MSLFEAFKQALKAVFKFDTDNNLKTTIAGDEVNIAKDDTLRAIKAQTDKLQFDANNFLRIALASDEVSVAKESTLSSVLSQLDIKLSELRDALKGADNKDFSTLEADVEAILSQLDVALSTRASESTLAGIKSQIDKLQFDSLNSLITERITGQSGLRGSYTIPSKSIYVVNRYETVIVKGEVYADGDLYVEGELVVV